MDLNLEIIKSIVNIDDEYIHLGTYEGTQLIFDNEAEELMDKLAGERILKITDPRLLYILQNNYNYNDGCVLITYIINNPHCCLSTALNVFFEAGGDSLLEDREAFLRKEDECTTERIQFLLKLENMLLKGCFKKGNILYYSPHSDKDTITFKKNPNIPEIFLSEILGEDLDDIMI